MFIAKNYFDTRFKKSFKKGEIVPDEIAKFYMNAVIEEKGELLTETPSEVKVTKEKVEDIEEKVEDIEEKVEDIEEKVEEEIKVKEKRSKKKK